jgi:hypothetical protein
MRMVTGLSQSATVTADSDCAVQQNCGVYGSVKKNLFDFNVKNHSRIPIKTEIQKQSGQVVVH